jgi:hypothetical protein
LLREMRTDEAIGPSHEHARIFELRHWPIRIPRASRCIPEPKPPLDGRFDAEIEALACDETSLDTAGN